MMKKLVIFLFFAALLFPAINISAEESKNDSVITVKFGFYVKKIDPDFKQGKFHTEFYWWAIFENDSSRTGFSNDDIIDIEYVNGFNCEVGGFKNEIVEQKEQSKNVFYYTGFHQGDFYFSPDFTLYPFDVQKLDIIVENAVLPDYQLRFVVDSASYVLSEQNKKFWGASDDLLNARNSNYRILKTVNQASRGLYNSNFGDVTFPNKVYYGRTTCSVFIDRSIIPYISKLLIPLMIILLLVYFVFYLPAERIDIAAGLTVTSLLSAIAFQLAVNGDLPDIGYIIYVDKIFYMCYFLISLSMAQSLITFYLDKSGDPKKVKLSVNLDLIFRILFPVLFFAFTFIFAL
jgi:hypothetical protein